MSLNWKSRSSNEKSYKARRISHEANTNIEYGEKTWTTSQTVRDLMQNHLDAETDRYFRQLAASIFDGKELETYFKSKNDPEMRQKMDDLLQTAHLFAKHVEDMTPETRARSEEYLADLAHDLPVKDEMKEGERFSPHRFLEAVRPIHDERPLVSYEIVDASTKDLLGSISYEELVSEPLYKDVNRYRIEGMKIVDHGMGFDSQLSALYISSKTGKRHLRGKFGEGAKMSELHLLRNGASMKMRSAYNAKNGDEVARNRVWQTRPRVKEERLISGGVEVEQAGASDTGSMVSISLRDAKEGFRNEFLQNVDPRQGGLAKNITDFGSEKFVYPMPLTEKHLLGVNVSGDGEVQYVQGLRVELAKESFGYGKPWYSYDFLDSTILAGRDRNEINNSITERIKTFWHHTDNPDLLKQLVKTAVHDTKRCLSNSGESSVLSSILGAHAGKMQIYKGGKFEEVDVGRVQKILDEALLQELGLQTHVPTLLVSKEDYARKDYADAISHAIRGNYVIKVIAAGLSSTPIQALAGRLSPAYKIASVSEIQNSLRREKKDHGKQEVVEGVREKKIRTVFAAAVTSVNILLRAAGVKQKTFLLTFGQNEKENTNFDFDIEDHYNSRQHRFDDERLPIAVSLMDADRAVVRIDAYEIRDPFTDPSATQRQIEIYLLSIFDTAPVDNDVFEDDEFGDHTPEDESYGEDSDIFDYRRFDSKSHEMIVKKDPLKQSQRVLDTLIAGLIPENSPLLKAIPDSIEYEKDPAVFIRYMEGMFNDRGVVLKIEKTQYETHRRVLNPDLTLAEAQSILKDLEGKNAYTTRNTLAARVFVIDGVLTYYDDKNKLWNDTPLAETSLVAEWNGMPVYAMADGRFFVAAPMENGAVLAKGEGKKREYTFRDGDTYLHIGTHNVDFSKYDTKDVNVNPAGIVLSKIRERDGGYLSGRAHIEKLLAEYTYYPRGVALREGRIVDGVFATAIPIEYGKDEWDNPVRVFQDIVQNHVDASEGAPVQLSYEVEQSGNRAWIREDELFSSDIYATGKITGIRVEDSGSGYYPSEIATMGASSKRSPLFAGKYGEGQKMVAAAALRGGFQLEYQSAVESNGTFHGWRAEAVSESRGIVIDGEEIEKKLVAFDVRSLETEGTAGSKTTLRLPPQITEEQERQWVEWLTIIDPRQRDAKGNTGLARYIRQLRKPGSERVYNLGSISVLLDEPGAVYENGLRINAKAEAGRLLAFGYDVPEIVTTRERNSYNADRLRHYFNHALSHATDPVVIDTVLRRVADKKGGTLDTHIGSIMSGYDIAKSLWAERAQKIWPGYSVYSSEQIREDIYGDEEFGFAPMDRADARRQLARREDALKLKANLVHLDKKKLLDVSISNYGGFSKLLPTAESFVQKLETVTVPVPPEVKRVLSETVAESTKVFADMYQKAQKSLTEEQLHHYSIPEYSAKRFNEAVGAWSSADAIIERDGVAVAPFGSAFHGKADFEKGVIFNEGLLLRGQRRELAETSLHEVAHILSRRSDYTEEFVTLLYDVAHHLVSTKDTA